MSAPEDSTRAQHEVFAKQANRETWTLLERIDRSSDDDAQMIDAAHASAYHWHVVGGVEVSVRADWLLAHVYAVLGHAVPADRYAQRCLDTCRQHEIGGFDLAYAYEAMARAAAAGGDDGERRTWWGRAEAAGLAITDAEDRELFQADLVAGPWFGVSP
jgi:hypothetical protein